jgi:hypothetical protein
MALKTLQTIDGQWATFIFQMVTHNFFYRFY